LFFIFSGKWKKGLSKSPFKTKLSFGQSIINDVQNTTKESVYPRPKNRINRFLKHLYQHLLAHKTLPAISRDTKYKSC